MMSECLHSQFLGYRLVEFQLVLEKGDCGNMIVLVNKMHRTASCTTDMEKFLLYTRRQIIIINLKWQVVMLVHMKRGILVLLVPASPYKL